jgi:hypothetical protein
MLHGEAVQTPELVFRHLLGQDNLTVPNAKTLPAQGWMCSIRSRSIRKIRCWLWRT